MPIRLSGRNCVVGIGRQVRAVAAVRMWPRHGGSHDLLHWNPMARWPRHVWTSIFTYGTVFVLFPLLCLLAYAWVRGWIF